MEITLRPIGFVSSPVDSVAVTDWGEVVSDIRLDAALVGGLLGLADSSHIVVVFYLHDAHFDPAADMVRHPRDRADLPLRGVFATRTQHRPNPIAVTTVQLLDIHDNVLRVKGLDALNGTPVLDIKPYAPKFDTDVEENDEA